MKEIILRSRYEASETLAESPLVATRENVVSPLECEYIINKAKPAIKRARVVLDDGVDVVDGRSGFNCWMKFSDDPVIAAIGQRIADIVGLPLENSESLQVIHYSETQEYRPHFDAFNLRTNKGVKAAKRGGQRIVTALVYLNNVPSGGGTSFPKLNLEVKSKAGRMVIFHNVAENISSPHPNSLHAGMPVTEGEKWAFNMWFRQDKIENIFEKKDIKDFPTVRTADTLLSIQEERLNDRWQHWISKCIINGNSRAQIVERLLDKGYSESLIDKEIVNAKCHPYVQGAKEVFNRHKVRAEESLFYIKKEVANQKWLLATYERLARINPKYGEIERIKAPPLSEFIERYIATNRPVIIVDAMTEWKPFKLWSFEYFRHHHGNSIVGIQDGRESDEFFEQNQKFHRKEIRFGDLLDRIENTESSNDFYMTAGNMTSHREELSTLFKDAENVNILGEYFSLPAEGSLWIGPRGTITPLHFDHINNFFCQIRGSKRVRLVSSWSLPWVYNDYHVYSEVDASNPDFESHPLFKNATIFDFTVEEGEILFIPVGWWHHLISLQPSISLTRKSLNISDNNSFSAGFVQKSLNFQPGKGLIRIKSDESSNANKK